MQTLIKTEQNRKLENPTHAFIDRTLFFTSSREIKKNCDEAEFAKDKNVTFLQYVFYALPDASNYIRKETPAQVFSCGFFEIFKSTFFTAEHLHATAFDSCYAK